MKRPSRREAAGAHDQKYYFEVDGAAVDDDFFLWLLCLWLLLCCCSWERSWTKAKKRQTCRGLRHVGGHGGGGNSEGQQSRGNQGSGLNHRVSSGGIDVRTEEYAGWRDIIRDEDHFTKPCGIAGRGGPKDA